MANGHDVAKSTLQDSDAIAQLEKEDLEIEALFEAEYGRMCESYANLAQLRDSLHARGDWEGLMAADALANFKSIEVRWLLYDRSRLHARSWGFTDEDFAELEEDRLYLEGAEEAAFLEIEKRPRRPLTGMLERRGLVESIIEETADGEDQERDDSSAEALSNILELLGISACA